MNTSKRYLLLLTLIIFSFSALFAFQEKDEKKIIIKKKNATGVWLGVQIENVSSKIAEKYGLKSETGAIITKVEKKSPAAEAGLKEDDIIIEFNGKEISDANDLVEQVQKSKKGEKVKIFIIRDKDKKTISAVIAEKPKEMTNSFSIYGDFPKGFPFNIKMNRAKIGVQLMQLNSELGEYFGSPTKKGMLVKKVEKDSPGEKAGVKAGDVIVGIGKETVEDLHDLTSALNDYKNGEKAELSIIRKGAEIKIPVEIVIDTSSCNESKNMYFHGGDGDDIEINMEGLSEGLKMIGPYVQTMMKNFKFDGLENDCKHIQIEMDKMKPEIEKMVKEIKIKVKEIDGEKIRLEIEKMKPELEKMKKELKENIVIMRRI